MTQGGVSLAFVAAKLARPTVGRVPLRPQTLAAFRSAISRRLVLVCAPAGYGKTTTTAEVIDREQLEVAWYKLDVLDHDPVVFIVSLTYALQERLPDFGELLLERVRSSAEVPFRLPEMVALFVGECAARVLDPVHIVLDDYQEAADSEELNWTLSYLLENLPERFRFIVLSRYDPAFSVSKLQLAGQYQQLGVDLLRFDAEQAAAAMRSRSRRIPSTRAIHRLVELTEGWPASLVLASFALDWLDLDSLETDLSDPRLKQDIYSYLAEQVYLREDAETRRFLQQTCCLEHITADLGGRLAEIENAHRQLAQLAAKRVFTFACEKEGTYRYHNLFRDYLRQRFVQEHGAMAFHRLQIRTIEALEACDEIELAVDLSLSINEPARALDIVARAGEPEFDNIRSESLGSWVSRLEWSTAASSPWTGLLRSQVHLRAGEFDDALREIDTVLAQFGAGDDRLGLYHAHSVRECALFWKGDMGEASKACELALAHAETPSHRAHTLIGLGSAALETRDWIQADKAYAQAEQLIRGVESPDWQRLRTLKALVKYYQGDARSAHQLLREAKQQSTPSCHHASLLNSLAVVELAMGDFESAKRHCERALEASERFGSHHYRPMILDNLGLCLAAMGDVDDGMRLVKQAGMSNTTTGDSSTLALSLSHTGTILRRSGHTGKALPYYEKACRAIDGSRDRYVELNCQANLQLVRGLLGDDTCEMLSQISSAAHSAQLDFVTYKALLYQALVNCAVGCPSVASVQLDECVPQLLKLGHIGLLIQEARNQPSARGLIWKAAEGCQYAQQLPHRLPDRAKSGEDLLGTLTPRERQILCLMAEGRRNAQIATIYYLSLATVKTHVNHIFAKLGVSDRVQAVLLYRRAMMNTPEPSLYGISTQSPAGNPPVV